MAIETLADEGNSNNTMVSRTARQAPGSVNVNDMQQLSEDFHCPSHAPSQYGALDMHRAPHYSFLPRPSYRFATTSRSSCYYIQLGCASVIHVSNSGRWPDRLRISSCTLMLRSIARLQQHANFIRPKMSDLFIDLTAPNGKKYSQPIGLFINNEWVAGSKGNKITSINPTDESEIASVHAAEPEDVDKAVRAARAAFRNPEWQDMASSARGDLMYKLSQLVEANKELLATIETWDNGKPYQVALNEDLAEVAGCIKYYAGYADKIHGQVIDTTPNKLAYTIREPVGVCGQIM